MDDANIDYSVVIPVCDEEANIIPLYDKLKPVLNGLGKHEIIFIDDGSTDQTFQRLLECAEKDRQVKIIKFRKNFGQSAALASAFDHASGKIVVTMDGDLQNDPSDIPKMVEKLREYDVVCGWRKHRKDPLLRKKVPSRIFNWLTSKISGLNTHDLGTPLRSHRREVVKSISVYGELHRYIPVLAAWKGYKITELEVKHSPREHGKSKYGGGRLIRGFLDLLTVYFLEKYLTRPMHLFGTLGILSTALGVVIGLYLSILKVFFYAPIGDRPLLLLAVLLVIFGAQFFTLGLMGEMLAKYRYETSKSKFYNVGAYINFKPEHKNTNQS